MTEITGKLEQAAQTVTQINKRINQSKNEFLKKAYLLLQDIWKANQINQPRLEAVNFGDYTVRPGQGRKLELLKQGEVLLRFENDECQDHGLKLTDMTALKQYYEAAKQQLTEWEQANRLQEQAIARKMFAFLRSSNLAEIRGSSKTLKVDINTKILTFTPNDGGDPQFQATWTGSSWRVDTNQLSQEEKDKWLQWKIQTEKQQEQKRQNPKGKGIELD